MAARAQAAIGGRQTITAEIVDRLREEVLAGTLAPGSRLRQVEVAERLGVSPTPVREAFAALEREGLLVRHPRRGVVVFEPTLEDVRQLYEMRIALEVLAIEKAVPNLAPADLAALRTLVDGMAELHPGQGQRFNELNAAFHERIYRAADRPRLYEEIASLRQASNAYIRYFSPERSVVQETSEEHQSILKACTNGDTQAASQALQHHLQHRLERFARRLTMSGTDAPAPRPTARRGRKK